MIRRTCSTALSRHNNSVLATTTRSSSRTIAYNNNDINSTPQQLSQIRSSSSWSSSWSSKNDITSCSKSALFVRSPSRRNFSTNNNSNNASDNNGEEDETAPFDRRVKLKQRSRAAESCIQYYDHYIQSRKQQNQNKIKKKPILPYDYFHEEVARRLIERLDDINVREEGFPLALEVGAGGEFVRDAIVDGCGSGEEDDLMMLGLEDDDDDDDADKCNAAAGDGGDDDGVLIVGGRGGVRKLVQMDACPSMLHRDDAITAEINNNNVSNKNNMNENKTKICETYKLAASPDERTPLPFPDATFDLVVSSMSFHWVNDLPRLLTEIERVLKPDGCLLFALPGGNTLPELRSSLVLAELERTGGVSTHVGPYVDLSNVGSLLTGTGFRLPTIDIDDISIGYPNAMVLMEHLARMGEGNACASRKERVGLGTFLGGACLYRELYPAEEYDEGGGGGGIVASAQVIYGIAWKEHESQQKPDDRGSATGRLTDISVTKTEGGA